MAKPESTFFKKTDGEPSIRNANKLIEEQIEELTLLKDAFEDELDQGAVERCGIRLDTLIKIKNKLPVKPENLKLLLQFGNNSKLPDLANYPHILERNSLTFKH